MVRDYPVTGIGFGALGESVAAYLPAGEAERWAQIHNDYLDVCIAGGVVAVALCAWLAAGFVSRVARGVRVESRGGRRVPAVGLVLGLVAVAAHEAVDFSLQIPANALLFVVLAAVAAAPGSVEEART
jgi:hypothetical protein